MKIIKIDCRNILIFVFLFLCCTALAQRKDFNYRFDARIMDADTAVAIPNCHIINKTQNKVTVSDQFGFFSITANTGDSIMISSIGYESLTIAANDSMYSNNRIIKLQPAVYFLTEMEIGLLSTYDRFKRDILSREAQEAYRLAHDGDKYAPFKPPLPNQGGVNIPLNILGAMASPVTFFYDLLSTEGKQFRHYLSVINGTAEFIIIGEKFNGFIVREITGFENDELVKFMSYCRFSKDYLLMASEMEIRRAIIRKYKEYVISE